MKRIADHLTKKAKSMGYPARSIFKLEEIEQRFKILSGKKILDIGAAPGSWSLYCSNKKKKEVVSVDLKALEVSSPGITEIQGDIFDDLIRQKIASLGPYDTIISDAAPGTTGNRTVDTARSFSLVESIIRYSFEHLKPGGNLVLKIFQGGDERELMQLLQNSFEKSKAFKPKASRDESFEVFFVATGYTGHVE